MPQMCWVCDIFTCIQGKGPRQSVKLNLLKCLFIRNVVSCCPLKGRGEAVTHWTATSCARAAALAASRTSQPKSPLTANKPPFQPSDSQKSKDTQHVTHFCWHRREMTLLCSVQSYFFFFLFFFCLVALSRHKHHYSSLCWYPAAISLAEEHFLLLI